jgi:hypothetical protein
MGSLTKLALAVFLLAAAAPSLAAPSIGPQPTCWSATSNTAMSITGDICLSASKITFGNGAALSLTRVASSPAFKTEDMGSPPAEIFKVDKPATLTLLHTNTFEASWIVVFPSPAVPGGSQGIGMETFDGDKMPVDDSSMTGSYFYDPK